MDDNKIKHLKPRKNSKYHQGYVDKNKCRKLYDSVKDEPIIYRSGLELQFINFCEMNDTILKWSSEPIAIKYYNRLKKKEANYYPDYVIEMKNKSGETQHVIVEIKPYGQTKMPKENDSRWLKEMWVINTDKWNAATKFAKDHNAKFIIVTEKFFENV